MVKVHHIFGGISQSELEGVLDEAGFLTTIGKKLLERIGVKTGARVSIGESTVQKLVSLYNSNSHTKKENRLRGLNIQQVSFLRVHLAS
jgi:choline kinase